MNMKKISALLFFSIVSIGGFYYLLMEEKEDEQTEHLIERLYEGVTGKISQRERDTIEQACGQKSPVYGEILYSSWRTILNDLQPTEQDVLYDLGCGVGKVAIQALLDTPIKRVVGIELSQTRAARAQQAKTQLGQEGRIPKGKQLDIYNQNILDAHLDDATIVYMCSTCYPDQLMDDIITRLEQVPVKNKLRVVTLKKLPETPSFILMKQHKLPMTWSKDAGSPVYVYERVLEH